MLRRMLMVLITALAFVGSPATAQDASGYWTGTLAVTPAITLPVGVAIARDDAGMLTGTLDSPDQNAFDIPLAAIEAEADRLAFTVPVLEARFEGRWNAARALWEGTYTQVGQTWPLELAAGERPDRPVAPPLPASWDIPGDAAIGALLDTRLAGRAGAGIVVGVREPGGNRIIARGPAGGPAMDGDTLFEIGSITKVFTALLLAQAVLAGEVALDDPVQMHLPPGATMPQGGGAAITLRQLSQHSSGLPRLPDNMTYGDPLDPYADYTTAMMYEFLVGHTLRRAPGAEFEYSNLGVGLLGQVLADAAGTDYATLVRTRILDPLGMTDTAIALSPDQQARFATPHDVYLRPTSPWNLPALAGAGGLRSTANDMLRFAAAVLDPASPIAPAMALTVAEWDPAAVGRLTALGWIGTAPPTGPVLMHSGGTGGFRTLIALQPSTGHAVVALANAAVEPAADDIGLHLLFGAPLRDAAPVLPAPPPPLARTAIALTPAQLDHVTGTYRLAPGFDAVIRRAGDEPTAQLTVQLTGQPALAIFPSAPLEFFLRAVDAQLSFTEEDGRVTGAVLHQNGQDLPAPRVAD